MLIEIVIFTSIDRWD